MLLGLAAVLLAIGIFGELEWARLAGAAVLTLASFDVSARLFVWSRRVEIEVASGSRRMSSWEIRPALLVIYLAIAALMAIGITTEGEEALAGLLFYPAAVLLMLIYIGRARVGDVLFDIDLPT